MGGINDSIVGSPPMYPCVVIAQSDIVCYQVEFNNHCMVTWLIYVSLLDNFNYEQTGEFSSLSNTQLKLAANTTVELQCYITLNMFVESLSRQFGFVYLSLINISP